MSDSSGTSWSDNPYAPQITYDVYVAEKDIFAGDFISAILYGVVIVLFFQCMEAFFNPVRHSSRGIPWGLMAHTTAMFSFVTVYIAMSLYLQSISYIDNRDFPGVDGAPPGPFGYQLFVYSEAISYVPGIMFTFNQWLADGLLLYRCFFIYCESYWVIAFPSLMYLASIATGIMFIYQQAAQNFDANPLAFDIPYFAISVALNVLLTLMIVGRLVRHSRNIRDAMGPLVRPIRLYKAIVTIFVESSALYAISYILYIGPWIPAKPSQYIFFPILAQTQVIGPFLIILRVTTQRRSMNDTAVTGDIASVHLSQVKSSSGSGSYPNDSHLTTPMDSNGKTHEDRIQAAADLHGSKA